MIGVKGKEDFLVNSVENNLPCSFYVLDDCYEDIMRSCPGIPEVMQNLVADGLNVNGRHHYIVHSCMGGDLKLLNGWLGLCGCSSKYPCIYCKAREEHIFRT